MNFKSFDLNLLRVLDALLETSSTTRAGQLIGLSQPAVSAALGRLRHALGDPLFVRHGRTLVATDFAESLREPLSELLQHTEQMLAGPERFDPSTESAGFKISGSDFFAEMLAPKLAETLAHSAPGISVQMVDLVPDNYVDTIERYEVDLALIPKTDFPSWVGYETLFHSTFSVIARRDHPAIAETGTRAGDTLPLDLFCSLKHILFSPEGNNRGMGDAALESIGRTRRVIMSLPVFSGVYNAVSESDMIALLPTTLADKVAPRVGLDVFDAPVRLGPAVLCMVWHKKMDNNPAHTWLRDEISRLTADLDYRA